MAYDGVDMCMCISSLADLIRNEHMQSKVYRQMRVFPCPDNGGQLRLKRTQSRKTHAHSGRPTKYTHKLTRARANTRTGTHPEYPRAGDGLGRAAGAGDRGTGEEGATATSMCECVCVTEMDR